MRNPLETRRIGRAGSAEDGYDVGRRAACRSLLAGPVRAGAARRLVELVLLPREHRDELAEIFDEVENLARAPTLRGLTAVAGRATAAHTCRGTRSLEASIAAISAGIDRRFSACESGESSYPLRLAGLGVAGRYGLANNLSSVYLTHTLEQIVESALFVGTVIEPACAPGAYAVRCEPASSTTTAVRSLLTGCLVRDQNTTIDFALEELTSSERREPGMAGQLQSLLLGVRSPVDVGQLVVAAHGLVSSVCDDLEIEAELTAAAEILDGSGLSAEGSLALGEAIGAITQLAAGLVSALQAPDAGSGESGSSLAGEGIPGSLSGSAGLPVERWPSPAGARAWRGRGSADGYSAGLADLARSVLRIALVVAFCADRQRCRAGAITIDERLETAR